MREPTTFGRHLTRVGLLLAPVAYLAQLLATAVHEFVGHGLGAILVGGSFTGLSLAWDGMGWAACEGPVPSTVASEVTILLAGVTSTCMLGLVAFAAATRVRSGAVRWVLLVVSASAFLEGAPYTFWSAWHVEERGDIGRILLLLRANSGAPADGWRSAFLVVGAALTVLGTVLPLRLLLQDVERSFPPEIEFTRGHRVFLATAFGVAGAASWWLFDWDQLVPGVGVLPQVTGGALIAATAAWFGSRPPQGGRPHASVSVSTFRIAAWWGGAVASAMTTILWLGHGVSWD